MPLLITGCGFERRRPPQMAFHSIYIPPSRSSLNLELIRQLSQVDRLEVIQDARQIERADMVFEWLFELREKVVVGRTVAGVVLENQIRLRAKFRMRDRSGIERISDAEVLQQRDISYNQAAALAKEQEEDFLYKDMQKDIVQQILRRLAAISPEPK